MTKIKGATRVTPDKFSDAIDDIIREFIDEEQDAVNEEVRAVAMETRKELKTTTPAGAGKYNDWGEYQSGWRVKTEKDGLGDLTAIIHQPSDGGKPGLTHLLEKGHANANGHGRARAFPHIAPAAEKAFDEIKRRLGNG